MPAADGATPDFAVVGRGLMGTACARHLAEAGHAVVLIGPDEPSEPAAYFGPFGSFHDAGRITRRIATDPVWARLSALSIDRYKDISARSGRDFYTPCGGMMAGPGQGPAAPFTRAFLRTAAAYPHATFSGRRLAAHYPMFRFAPGTLVAVDPAGGVIDPRRMRDAQEHLAEAAGAIVIRSAVVGRAGAALSLADESRLSAGHVVLAPGAYAAVPGLGLPRLRMTAYLRTVLFVEVSASAAAALMQAGMPSLIWQPEDQGHDLYLLPPLRYPNGRHYLKIGGEGAGPTAESAADLTDWFRSAGRVEIGAGFARILNRLMPDLQPLSTHTGACAVSYTATGYPMIGRLSREVTLLTGGNGAGAKCADELGRLGAFAAVGHDPAAEGLGNDFAVVFA
jgi:sarcosine oxidase